MGKGRGLGGWCRCVVGVNSFKVRSGDLTRGEQVGRVRVAVTAVAVAGGLIVILT